MALAMVVGIAVPPAGAVTITVNCGVGQKIQDAIQANLQIGQHNDFIAKAVMLRETAGIRAQPDPD